MKLGIVVSSGGAALAEVLQISKQSPICFTVITDRACGAEAVAKAAGVELLRVEEKKRRDFSTRLAKLCRDFGVERLLLFFDRLVSDELFDVIPTANIHPAALPAFKGLRGVEDAYVARVRLLGCSLHVVDESIDGGPLICQLARATDPDWPLARWQKIAFLMKVYCGLVWVATSAKLEAGAPPINASHGLPETWMRSFLDLQRREGESVIAL